MQNIEISIASKATEKKLTCSHGDNLLTVLQNNNIEIFAPCGGNGTCGKCSVLIDNVGYELACHYTIREAIKIVLPEEKKVQILTAQHEYGIDFPVSPITSKFDSKCPFGLAIDIGTTTLVFYFINLKDGAIEHISSAMNPQGKFGADVISRINYCNRDTDKIKALQNSLTNTINIEISAFTQKNNLSNNDIVKISVAANPTMLHFLLGYDPMPIALAPFTPAFINAQTVNSKALNLTCNPQAIVKTLPSISAYVGADIVAGIASIKSIDDIQNYLFLDIGTNGEMALVTSGKIYCCATAAGPAFEGGNIECGMGAFAGAISEYNSEGYKTIDNSPPVGICGSGLIDIIATMLHEGFISNDGMLLENYYISKEEKEVYICQQDIREIQLAKSAIIAGVNILVQESGLGFEQIDALFLAGGFGNYINQNHALSIGLLPKEMAGKIIPIGNTSGMGACLDIKSLAFEERLTEIVEKSDYIELSTHDDFVLEYAMNMNF